jgi:hypothetical protein
MLDDHDRDRFRPRDLLEDPERPSLINETVEYRDRGAARVLPRWPRQVPVRALIEDALAHVEVLLGRLEGGVRIADGDRERAETTLRALYLRSQDMIRVLHDSLELEGVE